MALTMGTANGTSIGGPSKATAGALQPTISPQKTLSVSQLQPTVGANINTTPALPVTRTSTLPLNTPEPTVDPYAGTPFGSTAGYQKAVSDFQSSKDSTYGSITDMIGDTAGKVKSSVLDFIDSLTRSQKGIDQKGVQNDMAREQGRLGVLDMVGTGIRSGGVTLNNAGAANSSAAEAMARAYGDIGRKNMSQVGNQYAVEQNNIASLQDDLTAGTKTFQRHAEEAKVSSVNQIVSTATTQLAQLNAAAQSASLPDRIAIEQEKARIRSEAMAKLSAYDGLLQQGIKNNGPADAATNRQKASSLLNAGTAPENSFNYQTEAPAQFQNTGPYASELPIFLRKPDEQTARA